MRTITRRRTVGTRATREDGHQAQKRRRLESESEDEGPSNKCVGTETRESDSRGTQTVARETQTPGLHDAFGWEHHHSFVREIKRDGRAIITEDHIWRAGSGSVKFPCCESVAYHKAQENKD